MEKDVEGVYSAYGPYWENNVSNAQEQPVNPYVYYLTEIDPIEKSARIVYLRKEEGSTEQSETKTITLVNGWNEIKVGDETWVRPSGWTERYEVIRPAEDLTDGSTVRYEISRVRAEIGDDVLAEVITEKYPIGVYSLETVVWQNSETESESEPQNPYVYYLIEINPLSETVRVSYLKKEEGSEPVVETKALGDDYDQINVGGIIWHREYANPANFYATVSKDNSTVRYRLSRVTTAIGDEVLANLIAEKTPAPEVTE